MHINLHFIVEGLIFIGTLFKVFRNKQKMWAQNFRLKKFPFWPRPFVLYSHIQYLIISASEHCKNLCEGSN